MSAETPCAADLRAVLDDDGVPLDGAVLRRQFLAMRAALVDAGALRDAAGRVSEWFCTEARHLEGPRIQGLRMAMLAYDRHMQPNHTIAARDKESQP